MRQWELDRILLRDQQHMTVRCAFCPWTFTGTFGDGKHASAEHRAAEHPQAVSTRRKRHRVVSVMAGARPVEENIAKARAEGAATWA